MDRLYVLSVDPEWAFAIKWLGMNVVNKDEGYAKRIAKLVGKGWVGVHAMQNVGGSARAPSIRAMHKVIAAAKLVGWTHTHAEVVDGLAFLVLDRGVDLEAVFAEDRGGETVTLSEVSVPRCSIFAVAKLGLPIQPTAMGAPWHERGGVGLQLKDIRFLSESIPSPGSYGVWKAQPSELREIRRQVGL